MADGDTRRSREAWPRTGRYGDGKEPAPPLIQPCMWGKREGLVQVQSGWGADSNADTPELAPQPMLRGQADEAIWWTAEMWGIERADSVLVPTAPLREEDIVNSGAAISMLKGFVATQDVGPQADDSLSVGGFPRFFDIGQGVRFSVWSRAVKIGIVTPTGATLANPNGAQGPGYILNSLVGAAVFPGCCGPVSRGTIFFTRTFNVNPTVANRFVPIPPGARTLQIFMDPSAGAPSTHIFVRHIIGGTAIPGAPIPVGTGEAGSVVFTAPLDRTEIVEIPGEAVGLSTGAPDGVNLRRYHYVFEIDL